MAKRAEPTRGLLWDFECVEDEGGSLDLPPSDGCSSQPDGPVEYLEWVANVGLPTASASANFPNHFECMATLPESPRTCDLCAPDSSCAYTMLQGAPYPGQM